jgi:predicted nucleic acid-binding protein
LGLGFVDCHLLASALMSGSELWSRDKRLKLVADKLGVSFQTG